MSAQSPEQSGAEAGKWSPIAWSGTRAGMGRYRRVLSSCIRLHQIMMGNPIR